VPSVVLDQMVLIGVTNIQLPCSFSAFESDAELGRVDSSVAQPSKKAKVEKGIGNDKREDAREILAQRKNPSITNTSTSVGIGATVYNKTDLAYAEKCSKDDRCWLVGLSRKLTVAGRDSFCLNPKHDAKCKNHQFSDAFYKLVGNTRLDK